MFVPQLPARRAARGAALGKALQRLNRRRRKPKGGTPPRAVLVGAGAAAAAAAILLRRRGGAGGGSGGEPRIAAPTSPGTDLNDPTLARKVESEIFRDASAPKGSVSVNVEHGVVYLRGEVTTPEQVRALVDGATKVDGVVGVENLLHLPGTPAPAKDETPGRVETT